MQAHPNSITENPGPIPDTVGGAKGALFAIDRRKGDGFLAEYRGAVEAGKRELTLRIRTDTRRAREYLIAGVAATGGAVMFAIVLYHLGMTDWRDLAFQRPTTLMEGLAVFLLTRHVWTILTVNRCQNRLMALHENKIAFFAALAIQDQPTEAAVIQSLVAPKANRRPNSLLGRVADAPIAANETAK